MPGFHDLNIPYTPSPNPNHNHADLQNTLAFAAELGYSTIALSLQITGKLPSTPTPIPISSLPIPKQITTVLSRITVTIADTTQNHRLSSLTPHYNLVALRPTNEKALQLSCNSLECDLISLDLSARLPFILKFKTVSSALQRGIRFEICYGPGIGSSTADARRNLIGGAASLIRATRGRGIILSSEARNALGIRGPYDVMNLAQVWGLGQERGKEALCEEAGKVVRLAGMKRTSFRGVIDVIEGGGKSASEQTNDEGGVVQRKVQQHREPAQQGTKRKASTTSQTLSTTPAIPNVNTGEEQALSKREQKRRAKKARLEGKAGLTSDDAMNGVQGSTAASGFPMEHEALVHKVPGNQTG
jgi:ribonuclease P/MRP protein subunit RPP1